MGALTFEPLITHLCSVQIGLHVEIDDDGTKRWFFDGKAHRSDGPAVEYLNGDKEWYYHGMLHRSNGPAIEYSNGTKFWFINNFCHRDNGPAIEWNHGAHCWYIQGVRYKNARSYCKAANITGAEKTLFLLKWDNKNEHTNGNP